MNGVGMTKIPEHNDQRVPACVRAFPSFSAFPALSAFAAFLLPAFLHSKCPNC
jgi:hypothetical protein